MVAEQAVRADAYYWRCFATGLCFLTFGLTSLTLGLIVFPALSLLPGPREVHARRVRRVLRYGMRIFVGLMRTVGVLTYEIHGRERLGRPGQIVIANHPSLIDVVFLLAFTPGSSCVVKQALWRNPFTRYVVAAAGYVSNRSTSSMIEQTASALAQGQSVIIFPEGTRTVPGQSLQFHRGAANIAMRAAKVVTPVFIRFNPPTLCRNEPWYRIPARRVRVSLSVGADLDPEPFRVGGPRPRAARALNEHLLTLFSTQLGSP
jgi:1-acyl-sn-glycerol-3-phosphate acyltransferase